MDDLVTVVIACLNAVATLSVQLEALAAQTYRGAVEVLVCDNGSVDGSTAVALAFAGRLPGLRVIDASRCPGAGYARNVGARESRGRFLVFCDADDEVAPDWLERMVEALRQHPFVAGRLDAERLNSPRALRSRRLDQGAGLQGGEETKTPPHAGAGNLGIHRDLFDDLGGFDTSLRVLEDTDFCWRAAAAGVPLVYVPSAVVHVRLRATLLSMFRQGRSYGRGQAELEERHLFPAPPTDDAGARGEPHAGGSSAPWRRFDIGWLAWQLGWRLGHSSPPRWFVPVRRALTHR